MTRVIEWLLGLDKGFLNREGEFSLQFNPRWPFQETLGAGVWNLVLIAAAAALVIYVYRHEARSKRIRVLLASLRFGVILFVIALLNRPVISLSQSRVERSVVAVMMDDSVSMRVRDAAADAAKPLARLDRLRGILSDGDFKLVRDISRDHDIRFFRFSSDPQNILSLPQTDKPQDKPAADKTRASLSAMFAGLSASGQTTHLLASVRSALEELQGQRLSGLVVISDGRSVPAESPAEYAEALRRLGVRVFCLPVGSSKPPMNVAIDSLNVLDSVFLGDVVTVRTNLRATGVAPGKTLRLSLKDAKTGKLLPGVDGQPAETTVSLTGAAAQEVELQFKPSQAGDVDVSVVADVLAGEVDDQDNQRQSLVSVLETKIAVLYVDGSPRWDYRYLKNEMIREKTVDISCLLQSADVGFAQEGDKPITRFPENINEMMAYDAIVFGDVDPTLFTDGQLKLVADFVSKKGGGFGMVAGPRFGPWAFRTTPIETILPVAMDRDKPIEETAITTGWRPTLTREGWNSPIFRFFPEQAVNEKFIKTELPPLFWYSRGLTVKPGVGEVFAEHPSDVGSDRKKAPVLVLGRFGAGRTMYSSIDDSWRWRFYTGESIFSNYWVQQLRYLARGRKLGQRRASLTTLRPVFELGEQAVAYFRILDPQVLAQLGDRVEADVADEGNVAPRRVTFSRQDGQPDLYTASWTADRMGRFKVKIPVLPGIDAMEVPVEVGVPRLELAQPEIDMNLLSKLSEMTLGQVVSLADASKLPSLLPSMAKLIPQESSSPLWDAPLALAIFVLLITLEWVIRKVYGMV